MDGPPTRASRRPDASLSRVAELPEPATPATQHRPWRALALVIAASASFAVVAATVKELSQVEGCGAAPPILSRGLFGFLSCLLWARSHGRSIRPSSWWFLLWRCAAGVGAIACYYRALGPGGTDLVTAAMLLKTSPLWVALLSPVLLRERSGPRTWLALALGLAGVVIASLDPGRGWVPNLGQLGLGLALVSGLCSAFAYIALRQLARTDDPVTVVATFSGALMVVSLPLVLLSAHHVSAWEGRVWGLLALAGLLGTVGQLFLTAAFSYSTAAAVTIGGLSELAMQGGISVLRYGEVPTREALIGGGLALLAGLLATPRMRPAAVAPQTTALPTGLAAEAPTAARGAPPSSAGTPSR